MDNFDDEVAKIMRQGMPEEEHEHIATHNESTHWWANQNLQAMRRWTIDLQILISQPVGKVDVRGFYIGLHDIVGDMHRHFTDKVAFQKKLMEKKKIEDLKVVTEQCGDARMTRYLLGQIEVYEILNEIHSAFTPAISPGCKYSKSWKRRFQKGPFFAVWRSHVGQLMAMRWWATELCT